ncbi:hypothetical protein N3K66_008656 [Trichothecium roseum]|uniref:Uncharacterized protein n=1 Tax=Trichothecium roseum TaxID=47278 RepID=A0ACC0USI1_9HYPO|nr:hypothetical protein N3K66_008656 [Trichothecium roseum]
MSSTHQMIPRPMPITLPIRLLHFDNRADEAQPMEIDQPSPVQSMIPPHRLPPNRGVYHGRGGRRGGVSLPSETGAASDSNTPLKTVTVVMRIEITLRRQSSQQPVLLFSQETTRTAVVGYHAPQTEARFDNSSNNWTRHELARLLRLKRSGMRMSQIRDFGEHSQTVQRHRLIQPSQISNSKSL